MNSRNKVGEPLAGFTDANVQELAPVGKPHSPPRKIQFPIRWGASGILGLLRKAIEAVAAETPPIL